MEAHRDRSSSGPWIESIGPDGAEGKLSEAYVLHACEVVSYFNYVNRMADGLSVQLEDDWEHPLLRMPGEAGHDAGD
jgi:hypothetical protein